MTNMSEFKGVTGQYPYEIIGITPAPQRFNGHPTDQADSLIQVERNNLGIAGDDQIAHGINDPFAFRED